ncbi:9214_t:CDS:1 [Acaulospora colombiana]|uniref:9214_t:CDS:1 n=1 Tax=Acaulospora colombiana TaxID=27376 RepID=A0ACA9QVR4_9GLOM|nr:9214_t:CDS:1 [Acaulospora colombiana]
MEVAVFGSSNGFASNVGVEANGFSVNLPVITLRFYMISQILGKPTHLFWVLEDKGQSWVQVIETWLYHNQAGHTLEKAKGELAANGARSYFSRS